MLQFRRPRDVPDRARFVPGRRCRKNGVFELRNIEGRESRNRIGENAPFDGDASSRGLLLLRVSTPKRECHRFNEFGEKSTSRVEVRSVCAEARFFVFVLFLQSCGVRLRTFWNGSQSGPLVARRSGTTRRDEWLSRHSGTAVGIDGRPATLVRPVGTGAVPTLGTTRRDGGRPDASMGNFVPSSHYVTDKTGEASLTAL